MKSSWQGLREPSGSKTHVEHNLNGLDQTVDLFRHNPHIDCKPILKQLIPETLEKGIRLVSLQTKPTEGVRHLRLDAWYYIRAVGDQEVVRALRETGHWTQRLQSKVEELMKDQKLYHVVIRGNDPKLVFAMAKTLSQTIAASV